MKISKVELEQIRSEQTGNKLQVLKEVADKCGLLITAFDRGPLVVSKDKSEGWGRFEIIIDDYPHHLAKKVGISNESMEEAVDNAIDLLPTLSEYVELR